MCNYCTMGNCSEEALASKAVKWLNGYFGDRDNDFFKVFPELPTLHFDDLEAGDVGESTSCAVAYTVDSAIARAYEPLRDTEDINIVKANGMEIVPEDVFVSIDREAINISNVHTNGDSYERNISIDLDAWVMDFIQAFDTGFCPSYDRNMLEDNYEIDYVGAVQRCFEIT
mgnify:CR=1 FL=1